MVEPWVVKTSLVSVPTAIEALDTYLAPPTKCNKSPFCNTKSLAGTDNSPLRLIREQITVPS